MSVKISSKTSKRGLSENHGCHVAKCRWGLGKHRFLNGQKSAGSSTKYAYASTGLGQFLWNVYSHVDRSSTQNWINIDWKWPRIGHFICGSPLFPPNRGHSTGRFQVVQQIHYMEVSWNRGAPSHPFIDRIFHERNHPAIGDSHGLETSMSKTTSSIAMDNLRYPAKQK